MSWMTRLLGRDIVEPPCAQERAPEAPEEEKKRALRRWVDRDPGEVARVIGELFAGEPRRVVDPWEGLPRTRLEPTAGGGFRVVYLDREEAGR